jgi:hypothetical protein
VGPDYAPIIPAEVRPICSPISNRVRISSLRHYVRAREFKAAGMEARAAAFVERRGGCRATFYNLRRRLGGTKTGGQGGP